jgi:lipid-binding SYLF domain-containing protein
MKIERKLLLSLGAGITASLMTVGCASHRTQATGGAAPVGTTTTATGVAHGKTTQTDQSGTVTPETRSSDVERLNAAATTLQEIMATPDKGIPSDLLNRAQCVAVIPGMKKGAFVVGAEYGKGYLTCRGQGGQSWTAPAAIRVEGGSFGFQIGGQETDVVLLVMNPKGENDVLNSQFTLGAGGSIAAGPVGRSATAQTSATMGAEILSYSRSRGVFAGLSLQGATLREDLDDNQALYGRRLTNRDIVQGHVSTPPAARSFINYLEQLSPRQVTTAV